MITGGYSNLTFFREIDLGTNGRINLANRCIKLILWELTLHAVSQCMVQSPLLSPYKDIGHIRATLRRAENDIFLLTSRNGPRLHLPPRLMP